MGERAWEPQSHPVTLVLEDDGRRSRVTVLLRPLLAFPHLAWLALWVVAAALAALANAVVVLVRGRSAGILHRFLAAYVRCSAQLLAFAGLVAGPFPGFVGASAYPAHVAVAGPAQQNRLTTAFRPVLGIPALGVAAVLAAALAAVGLLGWFAALATGRMPAKLRALGAAAVRYIAQTTAYWLALTDVYPTWPAT